MVFLKYIMIISLCSIFIDAKTVKLLSCSSSLSEVCGPHATCAQYCECNSNAYGEPPNCISKCKEDCKSNEICDSVQEVCLRKCEEDEQCGIDEYCRFYEGGCRKGCRSHNSCKDNEFCDPHEKVCKIGCKGDDFCKPDEICDTKNTCIKGCKNDEFCKENEYCDSYNDRLCKKGCRRRPGNCKKGEFCNSDNHECENGCEHDTHCQSNEICNLSTKKCYSYCYESPCGNNSVCTIVDNNRHCSCQPGYFPLNGIGCEPKQQEENTSVITDDLDCQKYCGKKSLCGIEDNKIACYCSKNNGKNPFIDCSFSQIFVPRPPKPPMPIGPGCIAVLCG